MSSSFELDVRRGMISLHITCGCFLSVGVYNIRIQIVISMRKNRREHQRRFAKVVSFFLSVSLIFNLFYPFLDITQKAFASQDETCPKTSNWVKVDGTNPSYQANEGYYVAEVCIKGGQNKVNFMSDGNNGCWQANGMGSSFASAQKIGPDSHTCQDISHASFRVETPEV